MPECLWRIRVKEFGPLFVTMDATGPRRTSRSGRTRRSTWPRHTRCWTTKPRQRPLPGAVTASRSPESCTPRRGPGLDRASSDRPCTIVTAPTRRTGASERTVESPSILRPGEAPTLISFWSSSRWSRGQWTRSWACHTGCFTPRSSGHSTKVSPDLGGTHGVLRRSPRGPRGAPESRRAGGRSGHGVPYGSGLPERVSQTGGRERVPSCWAAARASERAANVTDLVLRRSSCAGLTRAVPGALGAQSSLAPGPRGDRARAPNALGASSLPARKGYAAGVEGGRALTSGGHHVLTAARSCEVGASNGGCA